MAEQMKGRRNPNQCKIHHWKIKHTIKSENVDKIIQYVEQKLKKNAENKTKKLNRKIKKKPVLTK
jgi:hypothetical protein